MSSTGSFAEIIPASRPSALPEFDNQVPLFDSPADGILFFDQQAVVRSLNQAAERIFGYRHDELGELSMASLVRDLPFIDSAGENLVEGHREVVGYRKDGSAVPLQLNLSSIHLEGRRLYVAICQDLSERRSVMNHVSYLVNHDSLTGCLNRQRFYGLLQNKMNVCAVSGERLMVLFVDLDGFSAINDRYGHRVGDRLLATVANRLRMNLQHSDLLARVGGDEFALVIARQSSCSVAERFARRLLRELSKPLELEGLSLNIPVSIGVALFPGSGLAPDELLGNASLAMLQVKRAGGQAVCLFDTGMRDRYSADAQLLERLRIALAEDRLALHYQLQCNLETGEPVGMEALLRWQDGEYGRISPDTFLPLAEKHGLMPLITEWALRRACRENRQLIDEGLLDLPVAVNICASLFHRGDFALTVERILQETGLPANRLELEITEGVAMSDHAIASQHIQRLKKLGITFAMDDFGVGFSSLWRLKSLPFDRLKIDRLFVAGLPSDSNDRAIVQAIIKVATLVGMTVLAEGVETPAQAEFLRQNGCPYAQGYWYALPVSPVDLRQRIEDYKLIHKVAESCSLFR